MSFAFGLAISVYIMLSGNADLTSFESDLMEYTTTIVLVSNVLSLFSIWLFFVIRKKRFTEEVQLNKCNAKLLLAVALFGFGFSNVLSWAIGMIPFPESLVDSFTTSYEAVTLGNPIINFISVVIVTPIVEEVFFRGLIYTRFKTGMSTVLAAVFSAIVFGVMHGEVIWMVYTFVVGLVLVWVLEKTHSLLGCIVVHAVNNGMAQLLESVTENSAVVEYAILLVSMVFLVVSAMYINKHSEGKEAEQVGDEIIGNDNQA